MNHIVSTDIVTAIGITDVKVIGITLIIIIIIIIVGTV
jgi:hypothetical protein